MYQEAVNEIYGQLHNFEEGEEKENVSDQLRRADLLVALLQCYFTFLFGQLICVEHDGNQLVDSLVWTANLFSTLFNVGNQEHKIYSAASKTPELTYGGIH